MGYVSYITENGIEMRQFFLLLILALPWLLVFIIPISLFIAVVMSYNDLIASNEVTILKNSGLTKISIIKPAMLTALIASLISISVSFYFLPLANKKLRLARVDFENNYSNLAFNSGSFETLKNLTIYVKSKNENNELSGILLYDEREKESSITITATSGRLILKEKSLFLEMENGSVQRSNKVEQKSEILYFDNYVFNLSDARNQATHSAWKPRESFLSELMNSSEDKYKAEIHKRVAYSLMPIIFAMIGLSMILYGDFKRSGNTKNIVLATFLAALFFILNNAIYDLITQSINFSIIIYVNIALFLAASYHFLTKNYKE
jgi:lipopolysaccharide export system permease protein